MSWSLVRSLAPYVDIWWYGIFRFQANLLWNCYNRPLQCIRFVCARFRMTREEEEKIELSICIKFYVSMCLAYNFLWDVMLNGILYIYNAGILYSRLTHIHLFVSFARFNSYIYTHTDGVCLCLTPAEPFGCVCDLVAMRRGLAAMRRKTFHIPVSFFFLHFFPWSYFHKQQSLRVFFSIH